MGDICPELSENRQWVSTRFDRCDDILNRQVFLEDGKREGLLVYVEVAVSNLMLEEHVIGLSDVQPLHSYEEAEAALLAGNGLLFLQGDDQAYKISSKGYPGLGVSKAESEKVMRGSREGFTESEKLNVALIRKRLRDPGMKVEEQQIGTRSHTMTALVYMEDLVYPRLLDTIRERMDAYEIDGILDSGMLEQLTEKHWLSPFPQFQSTQRPDRTAMELLDGRVAVLCDNSPTALLFPAGFSSYLRVSEDRYNRFELVTFERLLRYGAMLAALLISGLYLSVINFHTQILPTSLLLSLAEARSGVPFPALVEVLIMEISFEMIREAGVRMPGPLSGTIGIVGGLIIGDAAVSANLVSPMSVIVVAFSALSSFAVPDEELSAALRLVKYPFILLGGFLGLAGIAGGLYLLGLHLCGLESFGVPYLRISKPKTQESNDRVWRAPLRFLRYRPYYVSRDQAIRLREKDEKTGESKENGRKNRTMQKRSQGGRS